MTPLPFPIPTTLTETDRTALIDLYVRGTPVNTLRAYERDLVYITAWKQARFGMELIWPETENVALAFILDHSRDLHLSSCDARGGAREAAVALVKAGLRKTLACPAPATLDRRIASWRAFHRMKHITSPFDTSGIRLARAKARRAAARPKTSKSRAPILREALLRMLDTCEPGLRGVRDRAILAVGWASGGRRRSELASLKCCDITLKNHGGSTVAWLQLIETKTTRQGETPRLVLKGPAATMLMAWIEHAGIEDGPLFRPISKSGRLLDRSLSPDGIYKIVKQRLEMAGLDKSMASPHGLRSGFLTQAALDGIPLQSAMQLSMHSSLSQAAAYYADADLENNPATAML